MRFLGKNILWIMLPIALFLISSHSLAHEKSLTDQASGVKGELSVPAPDLSEIIPSSTKLTSRLAALENKVTVVLDLSEIESRFAVIEANLQDPASQLQRLKNSKQTRLNKFTLLGKAFEEERALFGKISDTLGNAIRKLSDWRKEWVAEKKHWNEWQMALLEEGTFDQVKSTFEKANETIDKALNIVLPQMAAMLKLQERASLVQVKIDALAAQIDSLARAKRRGILIDKSPPMFSPSYFSQFGGELWYAVRQGLDEISWLDKRFFSQQGWIILLQIVLTLVLTVAIHRNREKLKISNRWRFLGLRPLSAGVFLGTMAVLR